jgi:hypothetical protein
MRSTNTLRRCQRSSRNRPLSTRAPRSTPAATTRTSTVSGGRCPRAPRRSSRTRSIATRMAGDISATSSRLRAAVRLYEEVSRLRSAPVNAPRMTEEPGRDELLRHDAAVDGHERALSAFEYAWTRASRSLPVPVSPSSTRIEQSLGAIRFTWLRTSIHGAEVPTSPSDTVGRAALLSAGSTCGMGTPAGVDRRTSRKRSTVRTAATSRGRKRRPRARTKRPSPSGTLSTPAGRRCSGRQNSGAGRTRFATSRRSATNFRIDHEESVWTSCDSRCR